ncbi:hypothetical protein G2W53_010872 [Senna tora]|uniref:Uncharacterized protein n=1 Tax=Senna tora TaxID=362788 RepID=A0A834X0Q0_9FABA|nr:hypothetical protein G2W53_010872 [Senna tora]
MMKKGRRRRQNRFFLVNTVRQHLMICIFVSYRLYLLETSNMALCECDELRIHESVDEVKTDLADNVAQISDAFLKDPRLIKHIYAVSNFIAKVGLLSKAIPSFQLGREESQYTQWTMKYTIVNILCNSL